MNIADCQRRIDHHWMPFTANREFRAKPRTMSRAKRARFWDESGREILDGCSSLFTTPAGHGRVEIAKAVMDQLLELDYAPTFMRAHDKAEQLAARLASILPVGMESVFFTTSGSDAVDTAIKMSLAYHHSRGESERQIFVSRERAYHGVNIGGTSLSGIRKNREVFEPALMRVAHMRHTLTGTERFHRGQPCSGGEELADDLLRLVNLHGAKRIAACFVEPVAGSTGCLVPPVGYLERLREICTENGILLVFDEIITGFGRTGQAFAADTFGVRPDIMTMAKALTNGAQPMAAVACSRAVFESVVSRSKEDLIEFFHGYTWSAHPAACAAAIATLDILQDEELFARSEAMSKRFLDSVFSLASHEQILDIRGIGMLAGIDVRSSAKPGMQGHELQKALFDAGLHVKATGDSILLAPPFIVDDSDIDQIVERIREGLDSLKQ